MINRIVLSKLLIFSPYALALIIPLITIGFIKYTFTNQFNQLSLVAPKQGILGAVQFLAAWKIRLQPFLIIGTDIEGS